MAEIRKRAANIPDDLFVVLVGDMITEEALPTYMNMLNTLEGTKDNSGADDHPWAVWTRKWTAEENRHGDLMNKYLWCTGKVNMKACETTIQKLIGSGMNPKTENNPYLGFVYTSFQSVRQRFRTVTRRAWPRRLATQTSRRCAVSSPPMRGATKSRTNASSTKSSSVTRTEPFWRRSGHDGEANYHAGAHDV